VVMDANSTITPGSGLRPDLPPDVDAADKVAEPASLIPLRSRRGVAVIAATVFASMAGFLDASVVNVAVPAIAHGPLRPSFPVGRASSILVTRSTAAFLVVALSGLAASSA
jgi:hypothetical protein